MPRKIAVVDDEPEMEFFYAQILEELTLSGRVALHFFSDSRLFLEWHHTHKADLLLTDINMPYLSGEDLGRQMLQMGLNIPTYFVSGYEQTDYKKVMKELGICRFLEKPLDFDQILRFIQIDLDL